ASCERERKCRRQRAGDARGHDDLRRMPLLESGQFIPLRAGRNKRAFAPKAIRAAPRELAATAAALAAGTGPPGGAPSLGRNAGGAAEQLGEMAGGSGADLPRDGGDLGVRTGEQFLGAADARRQPL